MSAEAAGGATTSARASAAKAAASLRGKSDRRFALIIMMTLPQSARVRKTCSRRAGLAQVNNACSPPSPACGRLIVVPDARTQRMSPPATGGAEFSFLEKRASGHSSRVMAPTPSTPPLPRATPPRAAPQETKTGTDYAADAVCAVVNGAWKATKFIAPIVGKAAFAVATPIVKVGAKVTDRAMKVVEPNPPSKLTQCARVGVILWRWLTG